MKGKWRCAGLVISSVLALAGSLLASEGKASPLVTLNFPSETELSVLADYVSQRLAINLVYDQKLKGKSISFRAPTPVPVESLLDFLRSVLRSQGFALLPREEGRWFEIVQAADVLQRPQELRKESPSGTEIKAGEILTQVFDLGKGDPKATAQAVKPFLTSAGVGVQEVQGTHLLVITDYADRLRVAADVLGLLREPEPEIVTKEVAFRENDAQTMLPIAEDLWRKRLRLAGMKDTEEVVSFKVDAARNAIYVVGPSRWAAAAETFLSTIDRPSDRLARIYPVQHLSPERAKRLCEVQLSVEQPAGTWELAAQEQEGLLVLRAPEQVHQKLVRLLSQVDVPRPAEESGIRTYKLLNIKAAEAFKPLSQLVSQGLAPLSPSGAPSEAAKPSGEAASQSGVSLPLPPRPSTPPKSKEKEGGALSATGQVQGGAAVRFIVNEETNSIMVIAEPQVQRAIEPLIKDLDKRRPQVLIEVLLVELKITSSRSVSVELGRGELNGRGTDYLVFSSFGLSTMDPETGSRTVGVSPGFNGVVIRPKDFGLVMKALQTDGEARVVSTPRILVYDGGEGNVKSITEEPYTSVNASETIATTSFGGFVEAGTSLRVTPHIYGGDYVELEFEVELSSFTTSGFAGVPPARVKDNVTSTVTVPDGHTAIIGGLKTKSRRRETSGVPILSSIPVIGWLFRSDDRSQSESTLYAFLKPTILRDDRFLALKHISEEDLKAAGIPKEYPSNDFLFLR